VRDRHKVLVFTRESDAPYRARLLNSDAVSFTFCGTEAEVEAHIADADVILGSVSFPVRLLARAEHVKWIQVTGAGVDAFLSQATLPPGVLLTRADVSFGDQIAEYVIGHLLALTQRMRDVYALQASRRWDPLTVEFLTGRTMGILGAGSIGQAVAARARGMGLRTVGLARTSRDLPGFDVVHAAEELPALLSSADVLVLCLPLTRETRGFIGREELARLKPSAILINVARGAILDEAALIEALAEQRLRAAILDVFEEEPLSAESPLWAMENVTITSHHAGLNVPAEIIDFFLENLTRFRSGRSLNGLVDPDRGY
jgi:phosphoglycerate dehydrogenase-like enzyme